MPKHNNPLDLELGRQVLCKAFSVVAYDSDDIKRTRKTPFPNTPRMYVCGVVKKAEGQYFPGYRSRDPEDYEQATLQVAKYVWFYECRERIDGPSFLIHADDIIIPQEDDDANG